MKKPYADNSPERVLSDLLVIATVFVILVASAKTVSATSGSYYAYAMDNQDQYLYRSVKGKQTTLNFTVTHGSSDENDGIASWVDVFHYANNGEWMQVGFAKGWSPINNTDGYHGVVWLDTPHYYVDRQIGGAYNCTYFDPPATIGENHEYWVYLYSWGSTTIMAAFIDGDCKLAESGYYSSSCDAKGATESHNTRDQMNSYFFAMKAGTQWNNPVAFHDDAYGEDNPPYSIFPHPPALTDTWITRGKGS